MTTEAASQAELANVAEAAEQAYRDIVAGGDPTDSVVKAATAHELTESWTARACELTNRLVALDHIETAPAEKRAADHPVVDPTAVQKVMFPERLTPPVKKKGLKTQEPEMHKAASAIPVELPSGMSQDDRIYVVVKFARKLRNMPDFLRTEIAEVESRVQGSISKAARAVLTTGNLTKFSDVEERVASHFGGDGVMVMNEVANNLDVGMTKLARFTGEPRVFTTDPWSSSPYREIDEAILEVRKSALDLWTYRTLEKLATRVLATLDDGLRKAANLKRAGLGDTLTTMVTSPLSTGKPNPVTDQDVLTAGVDPDDVEELNAISAREALVEALSDPILKRNKSGVAGIIRAFNSVSQSAPIAARQADTLIPMLREKLQSGDDSTFSLAQRQKIESGLAAKRDPFTAA